MKLARQYGPIFRVQTPQGANIVLSGFDLVEEVTVRVLAARGPTEDVRAAIDRDTQGRCLELDPEKAVVYIWGDASRMAPDVEKAFVALYRDKTGASEQDAERWMSELKASHHYLVDAWPRS
jgi:hypothetical protein